MRTAFITKSFLMSVIPFHLVVLSVSAASLDQNSLNPSTVSAILQPKVVDLKFTHSMTDFAIHAAQMTDGNRFVPDDADNVLARPNVIQKQSSHDMGGMDSGGGDTTNPQRSNAEDLQYKLNHAGVSVSVWLNRMEESYRRSISDYQERSPFRPLFKDSRIFEILKTVRVKINLNEPCRDDKGRPKDGSVIDTRTVCLSPFTMAPKLNNQNEGAEVMALFVHEISHLAGANEVQAKEIQRWAVAHFARVFFDDLVGEIYDLTYGITGSPTGGLIKTMMLKLDSGIKNPSVMDRFWLDTVRFDLRELQRRLGDQVFNSNFLFARPERSQLFGAQQIRYKALSDYICTHNQYENEDRRQACAAEYEKGFGADQIVSAIQFENRVNGTDSEKPEWEQIKIKKITAENVLSDELAEIHSYLKILLEDTQGTARLQIPVSEQF